MKVKLMSMLGGILMFTIASPSSASATTPSSLVNLARNGYFQQQGIPSYQSLEISVQSGRINGEDLVNAAAESNRISSELTNDSGYIRSVDQKLNSLVDD